MAAGANDFLEFDEAIQTNRQKEAHYIHQTFKRLEEAELTLRNISVNFEKQPKN